MPELASLDQLVVDGIARYSVGGLAVAVSKDGRLVFARGYGIADTTTGERIQPESLFRLASVSKSFAAAAITRLAEKGRLDLDARVFDVLNHLRPSNGRWGDSRTQQITIRQLLHHSGGWDRDISGDPVTTRSIMLRASEATRSLYPPSADDLIRYMLTQKLDFNPGARYAYSNLGYLILGRVVEKVTGGSYSDYVRSTILQPIGLDRMGWVLGEEYTRLPGEVHYYDYPGAPLMESTFFQFKWMVPRPFAIWMPDSVGGLTGSTIDVLKFANALDGLRPPAPVGAEAFQWMIEAPDRAAWITNTRWYGFGLFVERSLSNGTIMWSHAGGVPGTRTDFFRFPGNVGLTIFTNYEPGNYGYLREQVIQFVMSQTTWPEHDLFPRYYAPHLTSEGVVRSAGWLAAPVAPSSLVSLFGSELGERVEPASGEPAGTLGGVTLTLRDAAGVTHALPLLYASLAQVNCYLPKEVATGPATLALERAGQPPAVVNIAIEATAPGLFTLNAEGLVAANVVRVRDGKVSYEDIYALDGAGKVIARSVDLGPAGDEVYLSLYGSGLREGAAGVRVTIGGEEAAIQYAGAQPTYLGLDQVNVVVPRSLAGRGKADILLTVDGKQSNPAFGEFR